MKEKGEEGRDETKTRGEEEVASEAGAVPRFYTRFSTPWRTQSICDPQPGPSKMKALQSYF